MDIVLGVTAVLIKGEKRETGIRNGLQEGRARGQEDRWLGNRM